MGDNDESECENSLAIGLKDKLKMDKTWIQINKKFALLSENLNVQPIKSKKGHRLCF